MTATGFKVNYPLIGDHDLNVAKLYDMLPATNGFNDIEIDGPCTAPDGEKIYFELSSTVNAMNIKHGIDSPSGSLRLDNLIRRNSPSRLQI